MSAVERTTKVAAAKVTTVNFSSDFGIDEPAPSAPALENALGIRWFRLRRPALILTIR